MIEASGLLSLLITLVVFGLVMYVLWWGLGRIGLPEPFHKIVTVILVLVTVVFLLNILFGMMGTPLFRW